MPHRRAATLRLLVALLLALLTFAAAPAEAAQPGEELVNSSGALSAGQTFTTPLYSPSTPANIHLSIAGGTVGDTVTMKLLTGSTVVKSWVVQSGETSWGYATLPASNGTLSLHNDSGTTLTYTLTTYARDATPRIAEGLSAWSGLARGNGLQSSIQLLVPTAGRYRFTLGATGGSFQLKVDANAILKTVVPGKAPTPSDSVYYVNAGVHTFAIIQDPAATLVTWSVALASVGDIDALPSSESGQVLGGGAFFTDERVPLQVAAAQPVNLSITVTGGVGDSLVIELYNGTTKVFTSSKVYGGEVAWWNSSLAAGANALHIVATGNSAALAYTVSVTPVARAPFTWSGVTYGNTARANSGHSSIQLTFPAAGLYRFSLGASAGRYQLLLDDRYLQKTVTDTTSTVFTAFVAAGSHKLLMAQDPAAATTRWSVGVASVTAASDVLPFSRVGGTLGGMGNAFREEWLPLRVASGVPINLKVSAIGAISDSLRVELYNSGSLVYSAATVYGNEVFWGTSAVASGTNLIHIVAASGTTGQLGYQIELRNVASIPTTWQGVARDSGLNSVVQLTAPVAGTYAVTLTVTEGAGQVLIDQTALATLQARPAVSPTASKTVLHVPLTAGMHTFKWQQDASQPRTVWQIATALRRADQGGQGGEVKIYLPLVRR
jgi:hypothetical protein